MNVLSLFDGISCGQVALERADIPYSAYYASEVEASAIKVAQANYPYTIQLGDVTKVDAASLPRIDLLIGGSPCRGFSFAGKGLNFDDPRSRLFFEYLRLKNELKPRHFLLENVRMKKESQDIITKALGVEPVFIDSADFSAQSRKRLYWTNIPIAAWESIETSLSTILEKAVDDKYYIPKSRLNAFSGGNQLTPHYKSQANTIHDINKRAPCLCAMPHGYAYGYIPFRQSFRRLTPVEWERLQMLPDNYTDKGISDTKRYHAIGNGWTVDVIAHIFKGLKTA